MERPQPVELPHLRYLVINDHPDCYPIVESAISAMIFPSTMTARFQINSLPHGRIFPVETHAKPFLTDDSAISIVFWSAGKMTCFLYNRDYKFEIIIDLTFMIFEDSLLGLFLPVEDTSWIKELSIEISSDANCWTHWVGQIFRSTPGLTKLTISANTSFDCNPIFIAILRGALPELKTLCIRLRDVIGPLRFSPLLRLVRQRHVDGRALKEVVICDERLKGPTCTPRRSGGSPVTLIRWNGTAHLRLSETRRPALSYYSTLHPSPPPPLPSEFITMIEHKLCTSSVPIHPRGSLSALDDDGQILKRQPQTVQPSTRESAASKRSYFASKLARSKTETIVRTIVKAMKISAIGVRNYSKPCLHPPESSVLLKHSHYPHHLQQLAAPLEVLWTSLVALVSPPPPKPWTELR
ncbi:hypothetical protein EW146_g8429 [Bondarzewia mesenterica]|uniref:Uncharacterized protein n=1 Tax=Bondarzewia mesenterica TaxID=1095465 RepID=A0A4S4LER7_9AGAM|nr:hypothetical protein EW146_g8429 [Bondarzewia mesenterica]